jgi:hypothetical protein
VDDRHRDPIGLGGQLAPEDLAEERVDHGMEALVGEAVPIGFGLPHVDGAQAAERGWSPARYERWLADSWCRLLLD